MSEVSAIESISLILAKVRTKSFAAAKVCSCCKETKTLFEFNRNKSQKDLFSDICRTCQSEKNRRHTLKLSAKNKIIKAEKIRSALNKATKVCSKCDLEKPFIDFSKSLNGKFGLRADCKICDRQSKAKYAEHNRGLIRVRQADYRKKNREQLKERKSKRHAEKYKSDPMYYCMVRCRKRITEFCQLKNFQKSKKTSDMIGCSAEELARHLESKFKDGMTWDNKGQWHIDHIIPLASAKTIEDVYKLNHFTNLQPLWAEENLSKGDKILKVG